MPIDVSYERSDNLFICRLYHDNEKVPKFSVTYNLDGEEIYYEFGASAKMTITDLSDFQDLIIMIGDSLAEIAEDLINDPSLKSFVLYWEQIGAGDRILTRIFNESEKKEDTGNEKPR